MLPNADHLPAELPVRKPYGSIAGLIAAELSCPITLVALRESAVPGAGMPKTAIDEDRKRVQPGKPSLVCQASDSSAYSEVLLPRASTGTILPAQYPGPSRLA